ncbi:MAG TPA: hypothetical protein VFZ89_13325 [Solirubrobacteraceae bacterium]
MRPLLLAIVLLLAAAPAAHAHAQAQAQATVGVAVDPQDQAFGKRTVVTGTVRLDGVPAAAQTVELLARVHPFDGAYRVLATNATDPSGSYRFAPRLYRNADLRVRSGDAQSRRVRAFVYPAFTLDFRARSPEEILVIARYRVPRDVQLARRTLFYVAERGRSRGPIVARAEPERRRPGRYRATAVVELPADWKGRFRYAGCLPYSPGSGMGDPKAPCPQEFRFE